MPQETLSLQAITAKERKEVTWNVKEALRMSQAWITNFQMFSNKAIGIQFEVTFQSVSELKERLKSLDIGFQSDWESQFERLEKLYENDRDTYKEQDIRGSMNVAFEHDEPELLIPIPMVPG